jgi:glyoxylase-like metal-dependent hydrolase (beta-lactamase superfamily II)
MLRVFAREPFILAGRPVGPFAMNQYLVICPGSHEAAIIDAGGDPAPFVALAESSDARITQILQTHAHIDHVSGLHATRAVLEAPILLHRDDRPVYDAAPMSGQMFGIAIDPLPPVDTWLDDGDTVTVGERRFEVLHTPGHCPGHVCYVDHDARVVIGGDLLFKGSVGRTDLPGSDPALMGPSLSRLFALEDDYRVFPGHMEPTTIGAERVTNPFLDYFGVKR